MEEISKLKSGATGERYLQAMRDPAFDSIRDRPILETQATDLLQVLGKGTVSTNVFLRRIHNFAVDMNWLPWPLLPRKRWPKPSFKEKRAITLAEHQQIVAREPNQEMRLFYQMLWHLGGAQSDIASLRAEDIDHEQMVISYARRKTRTISLLHFSSSVKTLLLELPKDGLLFPRLASMHEKHRAKEFNRRCRGLGISGVSLHSYRYAWAERAKSAGMPERFAQEALGHNSKAIHRVYARKAIVKVPALEDYESSTRLAHVNRSSGGDLPVADLQR
jgi:integrase